MDSIWIWIIIAQCLQHKRTFLWYVNMQCIYYKNWQLLLFTWSMIVGFGACICKNFNICLLFLCNEFIFCGLSYIDIFAISGLKSHDFYNILQFQLPLAIRCKLSVGVCEAIYRLSRLVRWMSSKAVDASKIEKVNQESYVVMCLL